MAHDSNVKFALEVRHTQCEITFQAAKLMFKVNNVLPNVASS
jgi:hypothetical protein